MGTTSITSTAPVNTVTHGWTGTANQSASVEYVDGTAMRRNLATNPSFEVGLATWSASAKTTATRDTSTVVPFAGVASAKLVSTGGGKNYINTPYTLEPGSTYTVSAWMNLPANTATPYGFLVEFYDNFTNYSYLGEQASEASIQTATTWTQVGMTFTMPDTATGALLYPVISRGTAPAGEVVYVDSILLETGSEIGDYFDGSTATFRTYGQVNPDFVDGWAETRNSRTVVNPIVGGGVDYILYPADLRSGTMSLMFFDEQDAIDCFQLHGKAAVFTITDTDRPSINMNYIVNGSNTRTLNDQNRTWWVVALQYQEVGVI